MFKELHNEGYLKFYLKTMSPLSIKAADNNDFDPTVPDNKFLRSYKDGKLTVVMPGSSIKGVFRSRAEKKLKGCDIFGSEYCGKKLSSRMDGKERYKESCPACKMFGNTALKSRILFKDAYPIGEVKMSKRKNVAIDRITGASKRNALFEPEVVEDGTFECEIKMENVFNWQIKVLTEILDEIDDGYVVFGGITSRGFGRMAVQNVQFTMRYYDRKNISGYEDHGFYIERKFDREMLREKLSKLALDDECFGKVEFDETL
ncbi:RAMP superfamily CRISPR-associated protein [Thermoanaerobacterium thermosaccharolyticum]|uniref:RAMP superfamily CRISPR-associated protein n=1 Tax=Thermoanaerobacterium thermosaccharolyticum TaxID=1517 RepID=UPI0027A28785|nr:RAMP superfamily CRISPR-associated protein [Thermoanaerobacterium thermosaccharolyticum]